MQDAPLFPLAGFFGFLQINIFRLIDELICRALILMNSRCTIKKALLLATDQIRRAANSKLVRSEAIDRMDGNDDGQHRPNH